jgi:hypothetical protein
VHRALFTAPAKRLRAEPRTAHEPPPGDLHDSFVPSDERAGSRSERRVDMQITSSIEPVLVVDYIVEAPGRHRRNRHEPCLCVACAAPLAIQEDACWRCGVQVPEPVRRPALGAVRAAPTSLRRPLIAPRPAAALDGMTPLWTRHTLGAIEADRDRRLERGGHAPIRYRTPRAETVVVQGDFAGGGSGRRGRQLRPRGNRVASRRHPGELRARRAMREFRGGD